MPSTLKIALTPVSNVLHIKYLGQSNATQIWEENGIRQKEYFFVSFYL